MRKITYEQTLSKTPKVKKVFLLTPDNIKQRVSLCESILNNKIESDEIFFTDERTFSLKSFY